MYSVLVIDDNPQNIALLHNLLKQEYKVLACTDGKKGLQIAQQDPTPNLILLDVMMPEVDGYEVIKELKRDPKTHHIPVIFLTAMASKKDEELGLSLGAVDYIAKPITPSIVLRRVQTQIAYHHQNAELDRKVALKTMQLSQSQLAIIRCLGRASGYKDNETGLHVIRMSYFAKVLADSIHVSEEWSDLILHTAPMHDVGKIGISETIIGKPGRLTPEEFDEVKRHPQIGREIIGDCGHSELLNMAADVALYHHEKWDGSGYPKGLKGEDIPLSARVVAVADVFDALTSPRPYKEAWSFDKAFGYVQEQGGKHFDPNLAAKFIQCRHAIEDIYHRYQDIVTDVPVPYIPKDETVTQS